METLDAVYAEGRPAVTPRDAERLSADRWGLKGEARESPSERDRVFEISDGSGARAFLKVSNALERRGVLEAETAALDALAEAQSCYRFPTCRPTRDGATLIDHEFAGRPHLVRLLEAVPGVPLDKVRPHGPELWVQTGRLIGIVDRCLADQPADDHPMIWDLRGAPALISGHLDRIADASRREILERALEWHTAVVAPRASELRESLIHNDANPANVFVDPAQANGGSPKVVGLVDFGDAIRSWTVADLAVACAYAGLDRRDPVGAFCHVARGYAAEHPVTEAEADVVFELARTRLALSVTISAVRAVQDPDNNYLLASQAPAWALLVALDRGSAELARYRLREACGHASCPRTARVVAALERAAPDAGPVLDLDPRRARTVTIDLSIESGDDGGTFDPTDHAVFSQRIFDQMRGAGAPIGIGRYDEVRWWYTGDAFRAPADDVDEWRTVHLGLDLFVEPGTPVLTPLAGRVSSVHDNDERLDYGPTVIVEHELEDDEGPIRFWTLYGHLSPETLEATIVGQRVGAGEEIGTIGAPPHNGDWAPHLHFQIFVDPLGYEGTFPGVAAPSQRETWLGVSPDPNYLLRIPAEVTAPRPRPLAALQEDRTRRLGPSLRLSYGKPLHIVRGRGARLYDAEGQPFLDCVNNVAHVGHAHPRVTAAACRQMGVLNTNTRYLHENILEYSERLAALLPDPLEVCFFVCSGTEANELALRMARIHTAKVGAVVLDGAYHGNSSSVINLSPYKFNGPGGKGLRPWVRVAPMPDAYRGRHRGAASEVAPLYAAYVREAIQALEHEPTWFDDRPPGAAAFFHESLLGCGGQIPLPTGYLTIAYAAAREAGAVCVADEVQVGFGRVGSAFWAFEEHGVTPDIVTLGKPMGNGHPLAAIVTTREIAESFDNGMEYFSTVGGSPVSCAIGLAVLDVIEEEGLRQNAAQVGGYLLAELEELRRRHPAIGDVRGRGLFLGIEFVREGATVEFGSKLEPAADLADGVVQRMRERGILLSTDGPDQNVIKIKPPLVFSEGDADLLVSRLDEVLSETAFA